jgi:glucosamine--fructose-6-phosphate aminotransferase (isomerizing)
MRAGSERGPATKTFAATLVVLDALARLVAEPARSLADVADGTARSAARSAEHLSSQLDDAEGITARLHAWAAGHDVIAFLGRGVAVAAAEVGALVMKEAAQVAAHGADAAEFRHGPLELAGPRLAAALLTLEPASATLDTRLHRDLVTTGSAVATIGSTITGAPHFPVTPVTPLLDVASAAVPLQLLAWALAQERHPRPGHFLVGAKVTTEE